MTTTGSSAGFDHARFEQLLGTAGTDAGVTMAAGLVVIGARFGLYTALADGALTSAELAARTGTTERYVREWACVQAAGGYLTHQPGEDGPGSDRFGLGPEQATAFEAVTCGLAEFFRTWHGVKLLDEWLPSLSGVTGRLTAGARVADIGCGAGITAVLMAQRFPASTIHGFDLDPGSIDRARAVAEEAGVSERVSFEVCDATAIPALGYDLVCTLDALPDHGHPEATARRVRECLLPGGSWLVVEPREGERIVRDVLFRAGFGDVRVTACTPFNTVLQARVSLERT